MVFSDVRIFQLPVWLRYLTAIVLTILVAIVRSQFNHVFLGTAAFVFFTVPVAISAFIGGIGPGLLSTILSLLVGTFAFLIPNGRSPIDDTAVVIGIGSNAFVWLFICIVCDLLRSIALGYKAATRERDEDRERLSTVFGSMTDGFFAVDPNWNVTHVNSAFRALIKSGAESSGDQKLWRHLGPYESAVKKTFLRARAESAPASIDVQEPGGDRWLHFRIFPDNFGMAGYVHDATYRKHIELHKERILANERVARSDAERASMLKDEFIATLSHELRTPLTSILGWTEILRSKAQTDKRTIEGLEAIERSTRLQTQLVEELLDMSRMSVGKLRLQLEVVELGEVVREAANLGRAAAAANQIAINVDTGAEEVFVRGDPSRLQQIAANLISNAIKFTPVGGHIDIKVWRSGAAAIFTVKDNGQGIDPSFLPFLFDRFRQANASITRSQGGLGLGLAIVKQLVDMHLGTVEAKSDGLGRGSEFKVTIPVTTFLFPDDSDRSPMKSEADRVVAGTKILVVDDDKETRELLNVILTDAGANVVVADSSKAALMTLSKDAPDVIVSDIGMPEVDGYQFIRTVRSLPSEDLKKIPAIALTAFAQQSDMNKAMDAGFNIFLAKPIEPGILLEAVTALYPGVENGALTQEQEDQFDPPAGSDAPASPVR